jgi:hypothetical protein
MSIESESRSIPSSVEVRCPQCGQVSKRIDITRDIYECPNCLLSYVNFHGTLHIIRIARKSKE